MAQGGTKELNSFIFLESNGERAHQRLIGSRIALDFE
jgi:hypothetical protein